MKCTNENMDWLEDIEGTKEQKKEIEAWCRFIGCFRYYEIYKYIKRFYSSSKIPYEVLHTCARYDFRLSDILFSLIKFAEHAMRAQIVNKCGNEKITKDNYLSRLTQLIGENKKHISCKTYYESRLKKECTVNEFILESGFTTITNCYEILIEAILSKEELNHLIKLRNIISHCGMVINYKSLMEVVRIIFKIIPSKEVVSDRKEKINRLYEQYCIKESKSIMPFLIQFSDDEIQEIIRSKTY